MRDVRNDGALGSPRPQQFSTALESDCRRRRTRDGAFHGLRTRFCNKLCRVLVACLQFVYEFSSTLFPLFLLFIFSSLQLGGTLLTVQSVGLFLLLKILCVLLVALYVQFNDVGVLNLVLGDSSLRLRNVNIVDEIESCGALRSITRRKYIETYQCLQLPPSNHYKP